MIYLLSILRITLCIYTVIGSINGLNKVKELENKTVKAVSGYEWKRKIEINNRWYVL